jgi:uncharacterized membrane protein YgdD (TMEM256/DUF423 family)
MHKGFIKTAAVLCALAVLLGAFGAHGLRAVLADKDLATFDTAVRYQFYHSFALLITGILFREFTHKYLRWAGRLFVYGIIVFSGSLYLLTLMRAMSISGFLWLGAITPIGGLCFVFGWIMMAIAVVKRSQRSNL